jgi:hypothetical protein
MTQRSFDGRFTNCGGDILTFFNKSTSFPSTLCGECLCTCPNRGFGVGVGVGTEAGLGPGPNKELDLTTESKRSRPACHDAWRMSHPWYTTRTAAHRGGQPVLVQDKRMAANTMADTETIGNKGHWDAPSRRTGAPDVSGGYPTPFKLIVLFRRSRGFSISQDD